MVNKTDIVKENSNRSYPSMVAHHQTILGYSINNQKIIHLFEIDTYCFFLIYWSDYFNMGEKGNLIDMMFFANP